MLATTAPLREDASGGRSDAGTGGFSVAGDGAGGFSGAGSEDEADKAGDFAVEDGFAVVVGVKGGFAVAEGGLSAVAVLGLSGFAVASVLGGFAVAGS